jgi:hypothetical protein
MAYTKYSLTPANNTAAPPDGAPEGMLPSAVNDTMRDMMSQIRDVGDGIRDGTYTMTAPKITGGTITGSTINNSAIGGTTAAAGKFTTLEATGVTTVQAGTASLPAITTTGDTNTGIFFPTADAVGFAVGGADAARLTNGTLSVSATSSAGSAIRLYEDTDNGTNYVDIIAPAAITSDRTLTLPDITGTLAIYSAPQITVYTSSSGTYTTPTGAKFLQVRMVGGGGGGGSTTGGAGGAGGASTFGSSFLTSNGGAAGSTATGGVAAGGTASGGDINIKGGEGGAGPQPVSGSYVPGGSGGNSAFGGGAAQSQAAVAGTAGSTNSGGGGSGGSGGPGSGLGSAGGGGAGGYVEKLITSPSSTYSYAVGAGGAAGTGGGTDGGAGGSGIIIVTAYFG